MKSIKCSIDELQGLIERDLKQLQDRVGTALQKTASDSVAPIQYRAPKAFGDLRGSVHSTSNKVVVDAPHAAAVEIGSRPHTPDFEEILKWVKLRGMQALNPRKRTEGPTTARQAARVGALLAAEVRNQSSPIESPEVVARAIVNGIKLHGTPPHWFVRSSLPDIEKILNRMVRDAVKK